jgi:hypothetical protein
MAAFALCAIAGNASILTAARPSGAGKTTLMAAMLAFLPPGERLRTVGSGASHVPRRFTPRQECLLSHEIGSGPYFGYLWGVEARAFFAAAGRGARIATNLHADDMEDLRRELARPELGVGDEDLRRVGVVAFMRVSRAAEGWRRRVSAFHAVHDGGHRLLWEWNPASDVFHWRGDKKDPACYLPAGPVSLVEAGKFLCGLARGPEADYAEVRRQVRGFLVAAGLPA